MTTTADLLKKTRQQINALSLRQNRLLAQETRSLKSQRRARTRTLIQMGGLLDVLDLPQEFDILLGEDLQLERNSQDKAACLLGFLFDAKLKFLEKIDEEELEDLKEKWQTKGETLLKMRAYRDA